MTVFIPEGDAGLMGRYGVDDEGTQRGEGEADSDAEQAAGDQEIDRAVVGHGEQEHRAGTGDRAGDEVRARAVARR
jgi:hypothetical protein